MDKKVLSFNMPCVLRQIPGFNNDNPIIVLFKDPEDALAYWHGNEYDDYTCGTGEGYNHLYIDQEVDITHFDHMDIKYMSHEEVLESIKREEEYWMCKVRERYPTDEEEYNRWYSMMEAKGWLSIYEACLDHGDPMDDDPEEQLARWCLNNNIQHNDCEAKKYAEYQKDEIVYYGHNEYHADDEAYLAFVEETLNLSDRHSYNDFMFTHINDVDTLNETDDKTWFEYFEDEYDPC